MRSKDRGGAIVERVTHSTTKREGVIRLEKTSMYFHARVGGDYFESKDGREVRDWLRDMLATTDESMRLTWVPVLYVIDASGSEGTRRRRRGRGGDNESSEKVDVTINRYYIALTPGRQEWRKLSWENADPSSPSKIEDAQMYAQSERYGDGPGMVATRHDSPKPFVFPSADLDAWNGSEFFLEYTPELWAGVQQLLDTIANARVAIEAMLRTKRGLALLHSVGASGTPLLLTSGDVGEKTKTKSKR